MVFISPAKAQRKIAQSVRDRRLNLELTQEGLAERSGVALSTLRKYEQKGVISLDSFLKLLSVVGGLEELVSALEPSKINFKTIDDVLRENDNTGRQRGRKK